MVRRVANFNFEPRETEQANFVFEQRGTEQANFNFEPRETEQANFQFGNEAPIKALFKIAPPTVNYELLIRKPKINHVELDGDKSLEDLGITSKITELIDEHDLDVEAHPYIQGLVDSERQSRVEEDLELEGKINNETRDRQLADTQINNRLNELADSAKVDTAVTASSTNLVTSGAVESAISTALATKTGKLVVTNPALTVSSGQCTWSITNTLGTDEVVCALYEVSSNEAVYSDWTVIVTSSTVTVKMNASADISAGVYRAVIIG